VKAIDRFADRPKQRTIANQITGHDITDWGDRYFWQNLLPPKQSTRIDRLAGAGLFIMFMINELSDKTRPYDNL